MRKKKNRTISLVAITALFILVFAFPASAALTTVYMDDPQNADAKLSVQFSEFVTVFLDDPTAQICQVWARSNKVGVRADDNVVNFNAYVTEFLDNPTVAGTWESYGLKPGAVLYTIPEVVKELSSTGVISSSVRNSDHIYQQMVTITGSVATITYNPATKVFTAAINAGHENDTLLDLLVTTDIVNAILVPGKVTIGSQTITMGSQNVEGVLAQLQAMQSALATLAGKTDFASVKLSDLKGKTISASDRGTTVTLTLAQ